MCSCSVPGKYPGISSKVTNGILKAVAETDKSSGFIRGIAVQYTCQYTRLVGDETDCFSVDTTETYNDILCKFLLNFQEIRVIGNSPDDVSHVIRLSRI